jgi:predicted MFS family arabinose efflux permease
LIASHFGWNASFLAATILAMLGALAWLAVDPHARLAAGLGYRERSLHPDLRT